MYKKHSFLSKMKFDLVKNKHKSAHSLYILKLILRL